MTEFYDNLLKATSNIDDITTERYATVTKLNGNYCDVKEEDTGLEHTNVPIINGANLSVGDKAIIGFLNNSIYDVVVYGALDKQIHDDSKQDLLVSGTNIKTINHQSLLGSGNITIEGGGGGSGVITNIECSDYNPSIDGNITVTITVNDVYGDAISDESVTVTASEGNFTQLNGSDITAEGSVTGTTNSSGQFTLTYTCSEWGLATFSAKNHKCQINVQGWKKVIDQASSKIQVYTDGEVCQFSFQGSETINAKGTTNLGTINSNYAPNYPITTPIHYQAHDINLTLQDNGLIMVHNGGTATNITIRVLCTYALKSRMN